MSRQLTLENIRKLKKVSVKMDGITVIAGLNDTGKSTISKALYGFIHLMAADLEKELLQEKQSALDEFPINIRHHLDFSDDLDDQELHQKLYNDIQALLIENQATSTIIDSIKKLFNSQAFNSLLSKNNHRRLDKIYSDLEERLNLTPKAYLKIKVNQDYIRLLLNNNITSLETNAISLVQLKHDDSERAYSLSIENNRLESISTSSTFPFWNEAFYIDSPLTINASSPMRFSRHSSRYQSPFRHAEYFNRQLATPKQFDSIVDPEKYDQKATQFLENIQSTIKGNFTYSSRELYFHPQDKDYKIPWDSIASGLKTFAYFYFLIKNGHITDQTLFIIDEPEVHLHPDWILKIAELIVQLEEDFGITFLINTHSPLLVEAFEAIAEKKKRTKYLNFYLLKEIEESEQGVVSKEVSDTYDIIKLFAKSYDEVMLYNDD